MGLGDSEGLPNTINRPTTSSGETHTSLEQRFQLQEEVRALLDKAVISVPLQEEGGLFSSLLLIPKKYGRMRLVINLKRLNCWVLTQHFKMEGIHSLQNLLKAGRLFGKSRLEGCILYFMVPVCPKHQQYLRFSVQGANYQFTCLPFGLACTPWAFTKLMKPVMAFLAQGNPPCNLYRQHAPVLLIADSPTQ